MKKVIITLVAIMVCILSYSKVSCAASETEPNDSMSTAQKIILGEEYNGVLSYRESFDEDEDYYKISVSEGKMYKITILSIADVGEYRNETAIVSLYKDSSSSYGESILSGSYGKTSKLFKASYTGSYFLQFWNSVGDTKYTFVVEEYNPIGKTVKDSESNSYKITGNTTVELKAVASKKSTDFNLSDEEHFNTIGGIEVLDYYDCSFLVTSIGKNAFKGCSIKSISLGENIKRIRAGAFQNCKKLGSEKYIMGLVIYGKKVVIEKNAFKGCKKLGTVRIIKGGSIKSVAKNAFKGTKKGIRLEVPSVAKYKKIFKKAGLKKPQYSKSYI